MFSLEIQLEIIGQNKDGLYFKKETNKMYFNDLLDKFSNKIF